MPTYAYACTDCAHSFEAVQKFTDDSLTECPECHGRLRKVYSNVGVVFKGSGFYRNDSRSESGAKNGAAKDGASSDGAQPADKGAEKTSHKGSDKSSEKGSDKPAAKTSSSDSSSSSSSPAKTSSTSGSAA